jgi:hypothetical protein
VYPRRMSTVGSATLNVSNSPTSTPIEINSEQNMVSFIPSKLPVFTVKFQENITTAKSPDHDVEGYNPVSNQIMDQIIGDSSIAKVQSIAVCKGNTTNNISAIPVPCNETLGDTSVTVSTSTPVPQITPQNAFMKVLEVKDNGLGVMGINASEHRRLSTARRNSYLQVKTPAPHRRASFLQNLQPLQPTTDPLLF